MKRGLCWTCVATCLLLFCVGAALARADSAGAIAIEVAPNVLNLASEGSWVTVHTDIPYGAVGDSEVTLNGVEIAWSKADSRGFFVAKFVIADIKGVVQPGDTAVLELVVYTDAGPLVGTDTVKVISVKGR
ncbi:MAG: hypothetical protein GXX96_29705 [Planctomycetaceae bacterium]|mgnify:CR=1 FL=1|nr:hypothetical protein [Planctomycetaceae bacterium]